MEKDYFVSQPRFEQANIHPRKTHQEATTRKIKQLANNFFCCCKNWLDYPQKTGCIALKCTLNSTALHCTALHCTALHFTTQFLKWGHAGTHVPTQFSLLCANFWLFEAKLHKYAHSNWFSVFVIFSVFCCWYVYLFLGNRILSPQFFFKESLNFRMGGFLSPAMQG